ncbi:cell wall integrity and stress response component 2-like [Pomacea canaliculata]|uniref:cell wall integrity and stress response component 2-like n=1 Tax=Pomacea canaliculata TaxID=400727 RepID=UPI000D7313E9|nr:cell wall integrity and stress response component 2-like [Pomacea canaliculata]XP_025098208.1 cell wall integrity and stress response component 2-like [Pomacea canaliculata]
MTLGSSVNILHWFVVVVVWQTGPWGTFHVSGFITTATHCKPPNTQSYLCTSQCVDQWVHVVSKKIQVGCDQTNNLQTNTSQSLTVTCAGRQQSSDMCSYGCLEHVTYSGSYTTVTLESECIDESSISNLCGELSDTPTNLLYLASPSLFLAPGPPPLTRCRCEIHAQPLHQVEILFADISSSMFTITCGQQILSDGNFTTNVTNTVMSLPDGSTDCVIEVDQRGAETTHRVWTNFTGSSLTFRCNSFSPGTSTSTTPSTTRMATSQQTSSLISTTTVSEAATSTVSSSPIVTVTTSRQTSELPTTTGATTPGGMTSLQTLGTLVVTQDSEDTASTRYIIAGVCVGVVVLIAAVVGLVFFIRRSKTIYDSLGPRVPHSPGVQTGDADHLYDVLQPVGMSSLQHSATAGEDNQRVHSSQQLNVQDPNGRDEEAAHPKSRTPVYQNIGMTLWTEAGSEPCQTDPQSNNGPPTVHL